MGKRHDRSVGKRAKAQTNKIISRLSYSPVKHKNRERRQLIRKLQQRKPTELSSVSQPKARVKFGSFNVNGLDLEVAWAVQQLLETRGFDVRNYHIS